MFVSIIGFVVALVCAAITITALKGKYTMLVLAFFVGSVVVWTIGACRLAKPWSVWARTFYEEERMAVARSRFPERDAIPRPPSVVRPAPPQEVEIAFWLLVLAAVLGMFTLAASGAANGLIAGPLVVFAVMGRAGHRWARVTVTVLAGLICLPQLAAIAIGTAAGTLSVALAAVVVLLVVAALVLLYRPGASDYYDTTGRIYRGPETIT